MKYHQQVSVDLINMVYTAIAYLALAGAAWLFLRLIQACFWLPGHMKRKNDVQSMLKEKVESYERYIEECEAKEAAGEVKDDEDERSLEEKRKERRECLDMLKRELKRIEDGGDPYDFDYLLNEEEKRLLEDCETLEDVEKVVEETTSEKKDLGTEKDEGPKNKQELEEPKKDK
ncbi:hypothetical protein TSAR_000102 [Trichomalopsis sarcophagae]|uniref:Uncharacterized protein n=1 Tax=Trichomalopsis sarcophagae TaxID=543379 RepID=A0A232FFV9_9HYME|nr:hypothetical protein TSAR_000102 [Trichomalopsis sarcophagae]